MISIIFLCFYLFIIIIGLKAKSYGLNVASDLDGFSGEKLQSKSRSRGLVTPLAFLVDVRVNTLNRVLYNNKTKKRTNINE